MPEGWRGFQEPELILVIWTIPSPAAADQRVAYLSEHRRELAVQPAAGHVQDQPTRADQLIQPTAVAVQLLYVGVPLPVVLDRYPILRPRQVGVQDNAGGQAYRMLNRPGVAARPAPAVRAAVTPAETGLRRRPGRTPSVLVAHPAGQRCGQPVRPRCRDRSAPARAASRRWRLPGPGRARQPSPRRPGRGRIGGSGGSAPLGLGRTRLRRPPVAPDRPATMPPCSDGHGGRAGKLPRWALVIRWSAGALLRGEPGSRWARCVT